MAAECVRQSEESLPDSWLSCASEQERARLAELLSQVSSTEEQSPPSESASPGYVAKTRDEAARMLGVDTRTIALWLTDPTFPGKSGAKNARNGHFPIDDIKRWRGEPRGGNKSDAVAALKIRKLAVETARREVELEQRLGRLISIDDVESTLATALSTARSLIEEIPDVIASAIPQTRPKLRRMVAKLARKKVRGVLAVLADAMRESIEEDDGSDSRDEGRADSQRREPKGKAKTTRAHGRRVGRRRKAQAG